MVNLSANGGTKRRIWVSGHRGMVGSAIMRRLAKEDAEIMTVDRVDVDLEVFVDGGQHILRSSR